VPILARLIILVVAVTILSASAHGQMQGLRVVLVPERNAFELRSQFKNITDFLAEKLERNLYLEVLPAYTDVVAAFSGHRRADAAFLGSYAYVQARRAVAVEPLVRPVWSSGRASCRSYIIARRDSGIENVADMAGKRLILTGPGCATGYFFPFFYLVNSGITSPRQHFSRIVLGGGHDTVVWSVFTGENDVGAVKSHVLDAMARQDPGIGRELNIIARSSAIPTVCFVVRPDLPRALREQLRFLLVEMDKVEDGRAALRRFGARRFIKTDDADYRLLSGMIQEFTLRGYDPDAPLSGNIITVPGS